MKKRTVGDIVDARMLSVGTLIGNYRIVGLIGEGGMGLVYEARHQYIGRQVAIKVLRPELARIPQYASRFLNEARAVNLVKHPGLLEIFEFGVLPDGAPHIIMEFLSGDTLSTRLKQAEVRPAQAPKLGRSIALAMAAAHEAGMVHRDLKPHNVFLISDPERAGQERVKVIDFGLVKFDEGVLPPELQDFTPRTSSGVVLGTPEYMAPEQCLSAARADAKADVYALGVMLYEMLAGQRPFVADLPSEIMTLHVRRAPRLLKELVPALPAELVALVHRMLSKRPAERPTMSQVAERLRPWAEETPSWELPAHSAGRPPQSRTQSSRQSETAASTRPAQESGRVMRPAGVRRGPIVMTLGLLLLITALFEFMRRRQQPTGQTLPLPRSEPVLATSGQPQEPRLRLSQIPPAAMPTEAAPARGNGAEAASSSPAPAAQKPMTATGRVRPHSSELIVPLFKPKQGHTH